MLRCKGIPKKQPQQQPEWKLNTGRTEAWKVLSPHEGSWDNVARILPNGSLLLPAVGIQDEGAFQCRAFSRSGKEIKSNYQVQVYEPPRKPVIVDPASELQAGVPNKVGTCVSKGGYPEGTLSWLLDGKPLIPDEKGVSVKEETIRHPETGLFTLLSELMLTPDEGAAFPGSTFSCSFSPGLPRRRALHSAPIQFNAGGSEEESGLGTLTLGLGVLGGLGAAALLIGIIMWQRRRRRQERRKVPEHQEEEEERAELHQSGEAQAPESSAATGPHHQQ